MTHVLMSAPRWLVVLVLASLPWLTAHADGDAEAVKDLSAHIPTYEQEITRLSDTADTIAGDYADGQDVASRVDSMVATWEEIEFHEAVETAAMPLYPPIWVALGQIADAVAEKNNTKAVRQATDQLAYRLHEGLGALKYIAAQPANEDGPANDNAAGKTNTASSDEDTISVIKSQLDEVQRHYEAGDIEAAKTLVFDTYMQRFEGIEGPLIEQDADLVTSLERDFNATLPTALDKPDNASRVAEQIKTMQDKLDRADQLLDKAEQNKSSVF